MKKPNTPLTDRERLAIEKAVDYEPYADYPEHTLVYCVKERMRLFRALDLAANDIVSEYYDDYDDQLQEALMVKFQNMLPQERIRCCWREMVKAKHQLIILKKLISDTSRL